MNEQIKKLAKQCWNERPEGQLHFDNEKFAELIVRECADKIKNADLTDLEGPDPDDVLWLVEKQIKEHFGVE